MIYTKLKKNIRALKNGLKLVKKNAKKGELTNKLEYWSDVDCIEI